MGQDGYSTPDIAAHVAMDELTAKLIAQLSSGGDARTSLDPISGLNKYFSAPYPRKTMAYASSTANDLSPDAFEHLRGVLAGGLPDYAAHLESLRA